MNHKKKKKILIVDDVKDFVDLMTLKLEAWGYEVVSAYDGQEGLKKIGEESPDLVLLDIMMPKMNGWEMQDSLKRDKTHAQIPMIILSAKNDQETIQQAKDNGVSAYIWKPELKLKLEQTLKKLL